MSYLVWIHCPQQLDWSIWGSFVSMSSGLVRPCDALASISLAMARLRDDVRWRSVTWGLGLGDAGPAPGPAGLSTPISRLPRRLPVQALGQTRRPRRACHTNWHTNENNLLRWHKMYIINVISGYLPCLKSSKYSNLQNLNLTSRFSFEFLSNLAITTHIFPVY